MPQFFFYRNNIFSSVQTNAIKGSQSRKHLTGFLCFFQFAQLDNRIQCIIQKMWMDLFLQQSNLNLPFSLLFQFHLF